MEQSFSYSDSLKFTLLIWLGMINETINQAKIMCVLVWAFIKETLTFAFRLLQSVIMIPIFPFVALYVKIKKPQLMFKYYEGQRNLNAQTRN